MGARIDSIERSRADCAIRSTGSEPVKVVVVVPLRAGAKSAQSTQKTRKQMIKSDEQLSVCERFGTRSPDGGMREPTATIAY